MALDALVDNPTRVYGSREDDADALESLSEVKSKDNEQLKSTMVSTIVNSLGELPEVSGILYFFVFFTKGCYYWALFICFGLSLDMCINQ